MTARVLFECPYGGCEAYGYCPCAEDEAELDDLEAVGIASDYPPARRTHDLPDISNYQPPKES
ncbi:hypothetical protein [Streptomyces sp. NPDC094468]|uniref:hypothetical protein n=1 Tax=Streptomyces sp. NPDC094468 TaxID=3366066 RepID=UPI0038258392